MSTKRFTNQGHYYEGIEKAWGGDTKHIPSKGFRVQPNTNLIERFHSTLKQRTKVMRGLKDLKSAKLILRAWLVHYNFFRPHEGIYYLTPSQKAGIFAKTNNWLDVVKNSYKKEKQPNFTPNKIGKELLDISSKPILLPRKKVRISNPRPRITPAIKSLR